MNSLTGTKAETVSVLFGAYKSQEALNQRSLICLFRTIFRRNVLQQSNPQPVDRPHRAVLGYAFSIAGAILILLRGLVRIIAGDVITFVGSDEIRRRFLAGLALNILGIAAVVIAIIIIVGAYLMYTGMTAAGGTIVVIFSVLSLAVGSGWLIGFILCLIGGILGLLKK